MPLARFTVESAGGGQVVVEVDPPVQGGVERVSRGTDGVIAAVVTFESALAGIKSVAATVRRTIEDVAPDEASVEMGFKLSAESGVILAKAGGEAHVKLTLNWKK